MLDHPDNEFGEQLAHRSLAGLFPKLNEALALEFAAEQRAEPRAGETEWMLGEAVGGQYKGVAKQAPDRARLDIGAIGRQPAAAALIPVIVKLPVGRVFHCWLPVSPFHG